MAEFDPFEIHKPVFAISFYHCWRLLEWKMLDNSDLFWLAHVWEAQAEAEAKEKYNAGN